MSTDANDRRASAVVGAFAEAMRPKTVYFVQANEGGPVKIGCTSDLTRRLSQLKSYYGRPVRLLGTLRGTEETERQMHQRFSHLRIGRTEQFQASKELLEFIGNGIYDLPDDPGWRPMPMTRLRTSPDAIVDEAIPLPGYLADGTKGIRWTKFGDLDRMEADLWLMVLGKKAKKSQRGHAVEIYVRHRRALMAKFGEELYQCSMTVFYDLYPIERYCRRTGRKRWFLLDLEGANIDEMSYITRRATEDPTAFDSSPRDLYEEGCRKFGVAFAKLHEFYYDDGEVLPMPDVLDGWRTDVTNFRDESSKAAGEN